MFRPEITPAVMYQRGLGTLPGLIGIEIVSITAESRVGRLPVRP